jgi:protein-glutamine gamma-glutamyltransferase
MNETSGSATPRYRLLVCCVVLAAGLPGLLFAPVFGLRPLLLPIAVVLAACSVSAELCARYPSLRPWRPIVALGVGLLGVIETELRPTTDGGLPTVDTVGALAGGVTESWRLTLQSTWPARPDADLLLFVPLLVLLTAVLGVELLRWPAMAVVPSVITLLLSQAFAAVSGIVATVASLGYAIVAAGLFMASRSRPDAPAPAATRRGTRATALLLPTIVLGVVAATVITSIDPGNQPAYSFQHNRSALVSLPPAVSPLTEVAQRLEHPDTPVFSYTGDGQVDRWRMVVLTGFDGITWTATDQYRRVGAAIGPSVTVPTTAHSARLTIPAGTDDGPWLPSQAMPASVSGVAPLIDPASGTLLAPSRAGPAQYELSWWEPNIPPDGLADAAVDPAAAMPGDLGVVPPGIAELARTATSGLRPSVESALVLERFLSRNYQVATGDTLPTGSSWPQLRDFLLVSKRGTSEQFAASYVALARIVGIPARLAVGFRAPRTPPGGQVVVRNGDVLAWPEVAVAGAGWVPLDPTGAASTVGPAPTSLAEVTARARAELPPPTELHDPPLPKPGLDQHGGPGPSLRLPVLPFVAIPLMLILLAAAGVPLAKAVRRAHRRRRPGVRGVVAAWREVRDLLHAHGTPVTAGMTVRDVASVATHRSVADGLLRLAVEVDTALWSGAGASDRTVAETWAIVGGIRHGLAEYPLTVRLRAIFDPRSLRVR